MSKLMSRPELALRLGCAAHTLAVWAVKGFGPPVVKVGARAMYDPADVERFIADRKRSSTAVAMPTSAAG